MRSFKTYDWMVAPGLGLKGLPLSLFALTASYNRAGCKMYESRESLAGYLGYSERQIGKALNQLVADELLICRKVAVHREFYINIITVNDIVSKKDSKDNPILPSFRDFMKNCRPMKKEEQSSCFEGKKVPIKKEESSSSKENKIPEEQEQSSPNNKKDNNIDNKIDNVLSTLSDKDFIEILYPIFFFKNNCDPIPEIKRFLDFYKGKDWKLGGGEVMSEIRDLERAAESWQVKKEQETGFHPYFIRGWKEVYKVIPKHLKKECLKVKTPERGPGSSRLVCSKAIKEWLNENKEKVELIFKSHATYNYKLEW